ncbi:MAG: glutamate--tRNA ligase [Pseudomonadota bacterium]
MPIKVRFAPSPTGKLHVGNVRTALINWLFAKKQGGEFILRIDDTDIERSTPQFEQGIRDDLGWLGLEWGSTFSQSDNFDSYAVAADTLRQKGLLYPCYETTEELDRKRKIALSRGRPPVYDRAALDLTQDEVRALEAEGRTPHWRFKLSGSRIEWNDLVRGTQGIETASVSDPILIRGDGSYLYTLPSVVDDIDAKITHVVRGEDHVTNSGAQIEIFQALGGLAPTMAHTPLLVGADGQGLSKRLGSLSIEQLRDADIEPMAIVSLLAKIGTSDPVEVRESLDALADEFDFSRIARSSARFDEAELDQLNAAVVHDMTFDAAKARLLMLDERAADETFWTVVRQNCTRVRDAGAWIDVVFGHVDPKVEDEDKSFIAEAVAHLPDGEFNAETWPTWTGTLKAETGRKGRGLFMPLRLAITGRAFGPSMADLIVLIGREKVLARLAAV